MFYAKKGAAELLIGEMIRTKVSGRAADAGSTTTDLE